MSNRIENAYDMPTMFLTDAQLRLLGSAEMLVNENYCLQGCVNHRPFTPCSACGSFLPGRDGYVACDNYATCEIGAA